MFWVILAVAATAAVDVTGMPPQIAELRAVAGGRKLRVLCLGKEGEAQVLRIEAPATADQTKLQQFQDEVASIASRTRHVTSASLAAGTCNYDSPISTSEGPPFGDARFQPAAYDMIFGPKEFLDRLQQRAVSCGFSRARIRPLDDIDRELLGRADNHPSIKPDWLVLDAGEIPSIRYQPFECYMTYLKQTNKRSPRHSDQ